MFSQTLKQSVHVQKISKCVVSQTYELELDIRAEQRVNKFVSTFKRGHSTCFLPKSINAKDLLWDFPPTEVVVSVGHSSATMT